LVADPSKGHNCLFILGSSWLKSLPTAAFNKWRPVTINAAASWMNRGDALKID
jgi:hypothetical protein